ncbi:unnamed protein product [Spirodela intermedia]|uniref:Uncharacterized protein n=1 Tax=Spirodela intermedia TaxID=51605 RepID=A0A7I8IR61_SPIIN|nr:unnamed protein product [Spirodela intermedia]CAA6660046.1 unnamed protein product [Spirodela intermedia]
MNSSPTPILSPTSSVRHNRFDLCFH